MEGYTGDRPNVQLVSRLYCVVYVDAVVADICYGLELWQTRIYRVCVPESGLLCTVIQVLVRLRPFILQEIPVLFRPYYLTFT